jgi:hypothetical protein
MLADLAGFSSDAQTSATFRSGSTTWETLRLTGYRAFSPRHRDWVNWSCCVMNVYLARTSVGVYALTFLQKKEHESALEPVRRAVIASAILASRGEAPRDVPVELEQSGNLTGVWSDKGGRYASTWTLKADGTALISFAGYVITGRWSASGTILQLHTGSGTKRYEYRIREVNGNRQLGVRTGAGDFDWMSSS